MKNPDEMVERVLAGLREVEAPAGLERRMLAAMEERAVARVGWKPMRWVVACAVVAIGVAGLLMMRPVRVPASNRVAAVVPALQPRLVQKVQVRNTGVLTVTASPTSPHTSSQKAGFHYVQDDVHFQRVQAARTEVAERVEMGGFPAPPMPLTESERLLLRIAHRADATELTPLNAEARERQSAEFDAEFMEFFATQDVPEDQTSSPENAKGETR
jgi:hypothetical protein